MRRRDTPSQPSSQPSSGIPDSQGLPPRGLRVAEAARYTGFTVWFIRTKIREGTLPSIRAGKRDLVLRDDCDRLLESLRDSAA